MFRICFFENVPAKRAPSYRAFVPRPRRDRSHANVFLVHVFLVPCATRAFLPKILKSQYGVALFGTFTRNWLFSEYLVPYMGPSFSSVLPVPPFGGVAAPPP